MAKKIAISKPHILQVDGVKEIREAMLDPDGETQGTGVWAGVLDTPVHDLRGKQLMLSCHGNLLIKEKEMRRANA